MSDLFWLMGAQMLHHFFLGLCLTVNLMFW